MVGAFVFEPLLDVASPLSATAARSVLQFVLGLHTGAYLLPVAMADALLAFQSVLASTFLPV